MLNESKQIRQVIEQIAKDVIRQETRSCFRVKKAKVITPPNGTVCSVQLIGDSTVLNLPYSSRCANVTAGQMVLIGIVSNNLSNAVVWETVKFSGSEQTQSIQGAYLVKQQ